MNISDYDVDVRLGHQYLCDEMKGICGKVKNRELGLWKNRLKQKKWDIHDYWAQAFLMGCAFCLLLWPIHLIVLNALLAPVALYAVTNVVGDMAVNFINVIKKRLYWGENYKAKEKVWEAKFLLKAEKEAILEIKSNMKFLKDGLAGVKNRDIETLRKSIDDVLNKYERELKDTKNIVDLEDIENLKDIVRICERIPKEMYNISLATKAFRDFLKKIDDMTKCAVWLSEDIEKKVSEIEHDEYLAILREPMENLKREIKSLDDKCLANENSDIGEFEGVIERVCVCNKELESKLKDCEKGTVNSDLEEKIEMPVGGNRENRTGSNNPSINDNDFVISREPINNNAPVMNNSNTNSMNGNFGIPHNQGEKGAPFFNR